MRHSQLAIAEPTAHADYFDVGGMIKGVISQLLKTPQRRKVSYGICEYRKAVERQTRGNGGHVLLGNSCIHVLSRKLFFKLVKYAESQISRNQHYPRITARKFEKSPDERASQMFRSSSAFAASYSAPRAV